MEASRKIAILSPGPNHLFWTTGIFFVLELGRTHDVVIVTNDDALRNDYRAPIFQKLKFVLDIVKIEFDGSRGAHRSISGSLDRFFLNRAPDLVYTHNVNYPFDHYLLSEARKNNSAVKLVYYQAGRMYLDRELEFAFREARDIEAARHRPGVRSLMPKAFVRVRNHVASFLQYSVYPMIFHGKSIKPVVNVFTGRNVKRHASLLNDVGAEVYSYTRIEAAVFEGEGFDKVIVRDHPARGRLSEFQKYLGRGPVVHRQIAVLPSWGFVPRLLQNSEPGAVAAMISDGWIRALSEIRSRFANYKIVLKMHPSANEGEVWDPVLRMLDEAFPNFEVLDPAVGAELLICSSEVIVGDVSSTLWWASLVGNKITISVDYFGYEGGDEMKFYPEIEVMTRAVA